MKEAEEATKAIDKLTEQSKALAKQFSTLAFNPMIGTLATFKELGEVEDELLLITGKISKKEFERSKVASQIFERNEEITKQYFDQKKILDEQRSQDEKALELSKELESQLHTRVNIAQEREESLTTRDDRA